ncbi:MAG: peptide chain release factor N(5)-glutamine methyltransferase [Planctomycetes bacterium]|nr:peptide chain release factor N(5)-glutamine methyltransferase [Planctomycetota bacterium]
MLRLLQWTTAYLARHGASNGRLDAEILLAHVRGCERLQLYTAYSEVVSESDRAAYRELVRQRASGRPVAYLVGYREFYSMRFAVTPDVLIPRPETESLVIALLDLAKGFPRHPRVADVGTGSGVLAICAAKYLPDARVTAIDRSLPALDVARRNAASLVPERGIEFVASDLFEALPSERRFDIVVSNPPYVSDQEFEQLPKDVRDFEPTMALVAGPTGTEIVLRLASECRDRLEPGGWLVCEISPMIADASRAIFASEGIWHDPRTTRDLASHERVLTVQRRRDGGP